jgi:hypothetical protein
MNLLRELDALDWMQFSTVRVPATSATLVLSNVTVETIMMFLFLVGTREVINEAISSALNPFIHLSDQNSKPQFFHTLKNLSNFWILEHWQTLPSFVCICTA